MYEIFTAATRGHHVTPFQGGSGLNLRNPKLKPLYEQISLIKGHCRTYNTLLHLINNPTPVLIFCFSLWRFSLSASQLCGLCNPTCPFSTQEQQLYEPSDLWPSDKLDCLETDQAPGISKSVTLMAAFLWVSPSLQNKVRRVKQKI